MHAIYVRSLDIPEDAEAKPLAVEIPDAPAAETIARNLAASFPVHGRCRHHRAYWFRARDGRHEIWSAPDRSGQKVVSPQTRSLLSRVRDLLQWRGRAETDGVAASEVSS